MNRHVPNMLSFSRIPLSFLLLLSLLIPHYFNQYASSTITTDTIRDALTGTNTSASHTVYLIGYCFLIFFFILIEISDVLDGFIARKYHIVSDLGKILDPYSDVFSRASYFICFSYFQIIPLWATYFVFAREVSAIFLRSLLTGKKVYLQANIFGKIKAVFYSFSGIFAIILLYFQWGLGEKPDSYDMINNVGLVIFGIAALSSVLSFATYLSASWPIIKAEYIDEKPAGNNNSSDSDID